MLLELMTRLSRPAERPETAAQLATAIGVEAILLFVRDPVLGALVPAQGLPQTVRGGPSWREFLAQCASGRDSREVEQPPGTTRTALALTCDGVALVALGGNPSPSAIDDVERALPLLAALFKSEQDAALARAEAAAAHEAAGRATVLATALEAARADAATLNADLREEQRRKDEFLAMLGHELRNPLSPLMNSVEILRRMPGQPVPERLLEVMARQITHLTRLVNDLLDASRVSRGRIDLQREPLLLSQVIHEAVDATRQLMDERAHKLTITGLDEPLVVNGDRVRLTQVFANLLNNAAKYTEPGGRVELSLTCDGSNAVACLTDSGIGISSDMLPRVFDLFAQAPASLKHAQGGLGIGLTLVRMLVELHGGRVSVASAGPGTGSSFTISLPLSAAPGVTIGYGQTLDRTRDAPAPLRVMIVDDNSDAADSLALLLKEMGHTTDVAYTAKSALELAAGSAADVVLLDIGLPGISGYEIAQRLRPLEKPSTRFIALTGFGTPDAAQRSREAGFDGHIVKPVTADMLRQILDSATR